RYRVETAIKEGRFGDAVAELTNHAREDFPPRWDLSPRWGRLSSHGPSILDLVEPLLDVPASSPAAWLRPRALTLLEGSLRHPYFVYDPDRDAERLARMLTRLPEGENLLRDLSLAAKRHGLPGSLLDAIRQKQKQSAP